MNSLTSLDSVTGIVQAAMTPVFLLVVILIASGLACMLIEVGMTARQARDTHAG